jgi:hypothetical protein
MKVSPGQAARATANDLRRSHFTLGNSNPAGNSSEYIEEYRKKAGGAEGSLREKLNVKASHFQIGQVTNPTMYTTVNNRDFKHHVGHEMSRLNDEKKADLRNHHFSFGSHEPNFQTLSAAEFGAKNNSLTIARQKQEQEDQKNKMRKHNFVFGETDKPHYSSVYNKEYNKEFNPDDFKQGLSAEALKQKVVDLRKSTVCFGADQHPMTSIHMSDYTSKNAHLLPPANDNVAIRKTNFVLGETPTDFQSVSQHYYVEHRDAEKPVCNKELSRELRATHFSLGQVGPQYASNAMASFQRPGDDAKPAQLLNPNLQSNHFSFAQEGDRLMNKTTYSTTLKDHGPQAAGPKQERGRDAKTTFTMGNYHAPFATETQSQYQPTNGKPADLEGSLKADLRNSHFRFNEVKPEYRTTVQTDFTRKEIPKQEHLSTKLSVQLRNTSFKLGLADPAFVTTSQAAFSANNGRPAELDPVLAKDLRSHHFGHGDGKWRNDNVTEYRESFLWKDQAE